jgi:glycosyltransferase involved in cell wall biosynthesis
MQSASYDITPAKDDLISIIIPCYNQGRFLGEALESLLSQSYPHVEIIVVDDGSTDNTREVAERYPSVRYVFQHNQGIARTRNKGLQQSTGNYLVFLDSDDYLCAGALDTNLAYLQEHADCAFVAGNYQYVNTDSSEVTPKPYHGITQDFYLELLKRNYIGMPGIVMYRREIVESIGGFSTSPHCYGCEDYELYLRITRRFPIFCHSQIVGSYRRHGNGISNKPAVMLQSALYVLEQQSSHVQTLEPAYHAAYRRGQNTWRNLYGRELVLLMFQNIRQGRWNDGYRNFRVLRPHILPAIAWQTRRALMRSQPHSEAA